VRALTIRRTSRRCGLHRPMPGSFAGLGLVLLIAGCAQNTRIVGVSPEEQVELRTRAVNLLLRAAGSDIDVVACNAIESLVRVAPDEGLDAYREAVRSPSSLVRYAGYAALGEVRDRQWLRRIKAGVRDPSPRVRLAAAFAACRCGQDGYARVLVSPLTDNPNENLRADAAYLLGRLGEARAEKRLRAALRFPANEKSNRATLYINAALATLGHDDAVQQLLLYAQGNTPTRVDALLILADLGNPAAQDVLRYALNSHQDYLETHLIAARGLGKLGIREGFDLAMRMVRYTARHTGPDDPDQKMRMRSLAAHALGEIGDPRALGALRELAADPADPRLQVAASYAICQILGD